MPGAGGQAQGRPEGLPSHLPAVFQQLRGLPGPIRVSAVLPEEFAQRQTVPHKPYCRRRRRRPLGLLPPAGPLTNARLLLACRS